MPITIHLKSLDWKRYLNGFYGKIGRHTFAKFMQQCFIIFVIDCLFA